MRSLCNYLPLWCWHIILHIIYTLFWCRARIYLKCSLCLLQYHWCILWKVLNLKQSLEAVFLKETVFIIEIIPHINKFYVFLLAGSLQSVISTEDDVIRASVSLNPRENAWNDNISGFSFVLLYHFLVFCHQFFWAGVLDVVGTCVNDNVCY